MSLAKNEIALIINLDSRRSSLRMRTLRKLANKYHLNPILSKGVDLDHAIRSVMENKKLKRLIIAGGDGSVATAARLINEQKRIIELAIIPVGTANYYSKSLGVKTLSKAFATAVYGSSEERHPCQANGRLFMIAADIGVSSKVLEEITNQSKKRFGKMAYVMGIVRLIFKANLMKVTIIANGQKVRFSTAELLVINHSIEERIKIMPSVHSREPYFEIVTYGIKNNKFSAIFALFVFVFSFGKNQKYLRKIKTTEATITTEKTEVVSIDGDSLERTPLSVKVINKPIHFVINS
jgi:diacylglycerol kinase (ATP)